MSPGQFRSNEEWTKALRGLGPDVTVATSELQAFLERISRRYAGQGFSSVDLDDLVQESLAKIVAGLDAFRGDSRFTTWAAGVLTRVAFTEVRRRRVRSSRSATFDEIAKEALEETVPSTEASPDDALVRSDLMKGLERAIAEKLTERQRVVILAELRGLPTVEIADQLKITTGALYKLAHDARKRLRDALLDAGYTADSIREIAEPSQ